MSKKIILLALAAASMAVFALPAMAMAAETDVALHVVPQPIGTKTIDGENTAKNPATLTSSSGNVLCNRSSGTATFSTSTTGTFEQTFHECSSAVGPCTTAGQPSGTITTTQLEFHLVTAVDSVNGNTGPGVLVTPNVDASGNPHFASFVCGGFLSFVVRGNGLVGTITKPNCGESSNEATIEFGSSSTGVQTHKTVASEINGEKGTHTPTEYSLTSNGSAASEDAAGIITLGEAAKLECT